VHLLLASCASWPGRVVINIILALMRSFWILSHGAIAVLTITCVAGEAGERELSDQGRGHKSPNTTASVEDPGVHMAKQIAIPLLALGAGIIMLITAQEESWMKDVGKMTCYFGAQAGMNVYMKAVMSKSTVASEPVALHGMPAGFAVTALQQVTSFVVFLAFIGASWKTRYKYTPKKLTTGLEAFAVILFSLSFTMNIALNNYSLSMIPISVNLIIRSCLPLTSFMSQQLAAVVTREPIKDCNATEIAFMVCGMLCATVAVYAKSMSHAESGSSHQESQGFIFGVIVCIISLFSGSMNLALAGVLGTTVHLNPLDTTVYMSIPAVIILLPIVFCWSHPISDKNWADYMDSSTLTDWQIFKEVCTLSQMTVFLATFSGVLALGYNVLQYGVVQSLSATHCAFAGNFNKFGLIFLSFCIGLETLPEQGQWKFLMLGGILGNISFFTAYNFIKLRNKEKATHEQLPGTTSDEDARTPFHK
jgi:hypothetical protein